MDENNTLKEPMIYKKIIAVMSDINAIAKGRRNAQQGFQFRSIDDVMNELHGSLAKCGVFVLPVVLEETRTTGKTKSGGDMFYTRQKIDFGFYAEDGSHVDAVVIGEAMDTGDKASNKALSIGLKYAMLQVFCIPTEDDKDPDAITPQFEIPKKAPEAPAPSPELPPAPAPEVREINGLMAQYKSLFSTEELGTLRELMKTMKAPEMLDLVKKQIALKNIKPAESK